MGRHGLDTGWHVLLDLPTLRHCCMESRHVDHPMRDGHHGSVDNGVHATTIRHHWVLHGALERVREYGLVKCC